MPRRASPGVRPVENDPLYGSKLVQQVINKVMVDGKKSTAEKIVYDALEMLSRRTNSEPVPALEESIKILTPVLEVRSRRVGGATYQVPVEVPSQRARTLAVRWLVEVAPQRRGKAMGQRLARGAGGAPPPGGAGAGRLRPPAPREVDGRAPRRRAGRRPVPAGRRLQAQGRHLPHGAGQQGIRPLPLVAGPGPVGPRSSA